MYGNGNSLYPQTAESGSPCQDPPCELRPTDIDALPTYSCITSFSCIIGEWRIFLLIGMACCTRGCESPVTEGLDARSLCAQFCG